MKVRELVRVLEQDVWVLLRTRGSQSRVRRPAKPGTVTVAGKPSVEVPVGTLWSVLKQAGLLAGKGNEMRCLVVIEKGETSFGAYVPDLPGCVAAAESEAEVRHLIKEAIEFHIEGLRDAGDPVPPPSSSGEAVDVGAA